MERSGKDLVFVADSCRMSIKVGERKGVRMLKSEGYKMFRGEATIVPLTEMKPFKVSGDWLYKPDTGCWYVNGWSYPAEVVKEIKEKDDEIMAVAKMKLEVLNDLVVRTENINEVRGMCEELKEWFQRCRA